jgi:anti-anti-sigma factor
MIPQHFHLRIDEHADGLLAHLAGPLDLEHAGRLVERLLPYLDGSRTVVVNLLRTDYIDSEGVRALLALERAAESRRADLRLVLRPGSRAERTLLLLRLQSHFCIHTSIRGALEAAMGAAEGARSPVGDCVPAGA